MASNNPAFHHDDDIAIIDIKSNDSDDDNALLINSNDQQKNAILTTTSGDTMQQDTTNSIVPTVDTIQVPSISAYRPTNILRLILFIEFLTILIIWFAGKQNLLLLLLIL